MEYAAIGAASGLVCVASVDQYMACTRDPAYFAMLIECAWRAYFARAIARRLREALHDPPATVIAAAWRGYVSRLDFADDFRALAEEREHRAATLIGAVARGGEARAKAERARSLRALDMLARHTQRLWHGKGARRRASSLRAEASRSLALVRRANLVDWTRPSQWRSLCCACERAASAPAGQRHLRL